MGDPNITFNDVFPSILILAKIFVRAFRLYQKVKHFPNQNFQNWNCHVLFKLMAINFFDQQRVPGKKHPCSVILQYQL